MATSLAQLVQRVRGLPEPFDYYSGATSRWKEVPREALFYIFTKDLVGSPRHFHHRFVLSMALEGAGSVILDHEVFRLNPGQAIVTFPFQQHWFVNFAEKEPYLWLFASFELPDPNVILPLRNGLLTLSEEFLQRLETALALYMEDPKWKRRAHDIGVCLALMLNSLLDNVKPAAKEGPHGASHLLIQNVTRYVHGHLNHPIAISDIAKLLCMSDGYLRQRFRSIMHVSLGRFILETRLHQACKMLSGSNLNIKEVASNCGFTSLHTFSRAFRRSLRQSPRDYRLQQTAGSSPEAHESPGT